MSKRSRVLHPIMTPPGIQHSVDGSLKRNILHKKLLTRIHVHARILTHSAPVAQLDRVPGYEPGGRPFESVRARHFITPQNNPLDDVLRSNGFEQSRTLVAYV
jgi:hypothetical protein